MCAVELWPQNRIVWRMYHDARSPIAALMERLETLELTECEASEIALKLRALHGKVFEIEERQAEEAARNARNEARNRPR